MTHIDHNTHLYGVHSSVGVPSYSDQESYSGLSADVIRLQSDVVRLPSDVIRRGEEILDVTGLDVGINVDGVNRTTADESTMRDHLLLERSSFLLSDTQYGDTRGRNYPDEFSPVSGDELIEAGYTRTALTLPDYSTRNRDRYPATTRSSPASYELYPRDVHTSRATDPHHEISSSHLLDPFSQGLVDRGMGSHTPGDIMASYDTINTRERLVAGALLDLAEGEVDSNAPLGHRSMLTETSAKARVTTASTTGVRLSITSTRPTYGTSVASRADCTTVNSTHPYTPSLPGMSNAAGSVSHLSAHHATPHVVNSQAGILPQPAALRNMERRDGFLPQPATLQNIDSVTHRDGFLPQSVARRDTGAGAYRAGIFTRPAASQNMDTMLCAGAAIQRDGILPQPAALQDMESVTHRDGFLPQSGTLHDTGAGSHRAGIFTRPAALQNIDSVTYRDGILPQPATLQNIDSVTHRDGFLPRSVARHDAGAGAYRAGIFTHPAALQNMDSVTHRDGFLPQSVTRHDTGAYRADIFTRPAALQNMDSVTNRDGFLPQPVTLHDTGAGSNRAGICTHPAALQHIDMMGMASSLSRFHFNTGTP